MTLPPEPAWDEGLPKDGSGDMSGWIAARFAPCGLPGFVVCLSCACPVVDGEQWRHWRANHGFKGF